MLRIIIFIFALPFYIAKIIIKSVFTIIAWFFMSLALVFGDETIEDIEKWTEDFWE